MYSIFMILSKRYRSFGQNLICMVGGELLSGLKKFGGNLCVISVVAFRFCFHPNLIKTYLYVGSNVVIPLNHNLHSQSDKTDPYELSALKLFALVCNGTVHTPDLSRMYPVQYLMYIVTLERLHLWRS